jgi:hypothetical protein
VQATMTRLVILPEDQECIYEAICAIEYLGSVAFDPCKDFTQNVVETLMNVADLLSISSERLQAPFEKISSIQHYHTIIQAVFGLVCLWVVQHLNMILAPRIDTKANITLREFSQSLETKDHDPVVSLVAQMIDSSSTNPILASRNNRNTSSQVI